MESFVVVFAVSIFVHVITGAQVPELGSQALRNALLHNLSKGLPFFLVEINPIFNHFTDTVDVFILFHCLFIWFPTEADWELVLFFSNHPLSVRCSYRIRIFFVVIARRIVVAIKVVLLLRPVTS